MIINNTILDWETNKENLNLGQWYSFEDHRGTFLFIGLEDKHIGGVQIYHKKPMSNGIYTIYHALSKMTCENPIQYARQFISKTFKTAIKLKDAKSNNIYEEYKVIAEFSSPLKEPLLSELSGRDSVSHAEILKPYLQGCVISAAIKYGLTITNQEEVNLAYEEAQKENELRNKAGDILKGIL